MSEERIKSLLNETRWARIRARALAFEIAELARQFAENDLKIRSGPRRGEPLGPAGRRARLKRLAVLHREYWRTRDAESHWIALLESLDLPDLPGALDAGGARGAPAPESDTSSRELEEPSE